MADARATIAVLGAGGIGGLLAALLARAGNDVVVVATDATAERLNRDGLHVVSAQYGDFTTPMRAVTELGEPVDLLIITTKHAGLEESLERIPADLPSAVLPMAPSFQVRSAAW